jgi:uncharacterized membrane protein YgcG
MKHGMKSLFLILLLATPVLGQRSLEFESMAVRARLDSAGALHVTEELGYVFNGDWNGGERVVQLHEGQRFTFENLSRREPNGELKPLNYGSVDEVDGYVANDSAIRWRSRLPSDPPFRNTRITYVLEYTLSNILLERRGQYILRHDFAFPERPGVIQRILVDIELDPVWQSDSAARRFEGGPLPIGKGFIIEGKFAFKGDGPLPEAVHDPLYERVVLAGGLVFLPMLLWWMLLRREEKLGRFAPLNLSEITPEWIERNLVTIPAEVAGAAWDEDVDKHEVSALLARWVGEGKVKSSSSSSDMKLELLVPRETFEGHERELIDKLFFDGDKTSTAAIKTHYASTGFNPSAVITRGVRARTEELAQLRERSVRLGRLITIPALLASVYFLYRAWKPNEDLHTGVIVGLVVMAIFSLITVIAAILWRGRIDQGRAEMKTFRTIIVMVVAGALVMVVGDFVSLDAQMGVAAAALMFVSMIINAAKSKKGPGAIAFRKRLASARQFFTNELQKPEPAIDDRWFPYVIAFGLDEQASSWATRFGAEKAQSSRSSSSIYPSTSSTTSSSSSSSDSPSWSGGGGAFGGAGATGTWAAAAGGLAAGVAAPSSSSSGGGGSSSGGGGGGGGSSSGGGSGGGW